MEHGQIVNLPDSFYILEKDILFLIYKWNL